MTSLGYEVTNIVDGKGQLSIRGGIIDIFPPSAEEPVRIELFDNEVDSLRTFDIISQRSLEKIDSISITPASEFFIPNELFASAAEKISADMNSCLKGLSENGKAKISARVTNIINHMKNGVHSNFYKNYEPYFFDKRTTIIDYCSNCKILFFDRTLF